jgi:excisionase family DNA binding protein
MESRRLLLSMKPVADILGVSVGTVQRRTLDGSIASRKIGNLVRIHQSEVDRIVASGLNHKPNQAMTEAPPNATILTLDQALHLSEPSLADTIRTHFAAGFIYYALPGPFGAIVRSYLPTVSQSEHAERQRKFAESERNRHNNR